MSDTVPLCVGSALMETRPLPAVISLPLSVVVLTKNEAGRLAECLDSVSWATEIVVVDDESTDRTLEVARRYTDRIFQRRMDIEGRHRNWAYAQAKHDWILSLDADERVSPELAGEIRALFDRGPEQDVYSIPRRNYIGNRWIRYGGWYPSAQVKLFRRSLFRWEETTVHPRALTDRPWGTLKGDILHYSYRDLADFVEKLNRQTTLEAQKWILDGRRMTAPKALWRSLDRFLRSYRGKEGYKDGILGFVVAVLAGMYQFLSYAKVWHLKQGAVEQGRGDGEQGREGPERTKSSATSRATLSVVILTKNEAAQIAQCLERVRWADEIIVVDGESSDGTPEICRSYGAKVITHRFEGDFGQERNIGNAQATKDWILQLDADDRVTPEFRRAAEEMLSDSTPYAAFRFRRKNRFLGRWMRHGGWYHYSLHLFRRGKAFYRGRVHHDLIVDGSIGVLEAPVEHLPFQSLEQFLSRQNRYTSLEAQEILEKRQRVPESELRAQMRIRPLKLFWKLYVKKQGFREGKVGLIFCGLYSFVHFMIWAKVWEQQESTCAS